MDTTQLTELKVALARLEERQLATIATVNEAAADIRELKAQVNRWRGATPVLLAVGGLVGWVITSFDGIKRFFLN